MEIGSEYWLEKYNADESIHNIVEKDNMVLLMSGRTAIDLALYIINKNNEIRKIYMPSYCCESMLIAFKERNMQIDFYDVEYKNGNLVYDINLQEDCDLFFAMNYFGFSNYNMDFYIENYKRKGCIVIEDSTHSLLSQRKYNKHSDVVIASLRKWFPIISGGLLIINNEECSQDIKEKKKKLINNKEYIELKKMAMEKKREYIHNKTISKEIFLGKFKEADKILKDKYQYCKIDEVSQNILEHIDINRIVDSRIKNVKMIYSYLREQSQIGFLDKIDFSKDCPLFVPIFLKNEKREEIRKKLICNNVFCPIHWPVPADIKEESQKKIYYNELSLICDQRYSVQEIQDYMNLIKNEE